MLEVTGLKKAFGKLTVVDDVSTTVAGGEAMGIMGPNGAGKSTFFDLLAGATRADAGTVRLAGQDISTLPTEARVEQGLARAFQIPKPFASLSVREHLELAAVAGAGLGSNEARLEAETVMDRTGLADLANETGNGLRLLDRKRLELAKALATRPRVILLDEISGGLTEHEVHELIALVLDLKTPDLAILWIEHIAHALKEACDKIMMLHLGAKIIEDTPDAVTSDSRVRELYLGAANHA
ncbi:ATP-binding cassette domain-containing protein [Lentibacter algarum]|uniref:ABC transporter ATP-binding protein n=1 Tax=Lentibacter algarum TaxID=576131 RepID=UPI001C07A02F|nr:ATP-binding cassette domain-containing protein [Lentibacter algarum]MBU2981846.1 ATP-binding cassette domain-containing protein [Lentibacter algarum]